METTIIIIWVFGAILLVYYFLLHIWLKEFQFAFLCLAMAAFPLSAFFVTAVVYAGLTRYFLFKFPKSFKQLFADLKNELMIDFLITTKLTERKEAEMK